jgi:predicted Zn-dependent protease with MMP-like domain
MSPDLFKKAVAKAVREIPDEFRERMEDVEVLVEEFADAETLRSLGLESPWELLGLYVGVPLTQRSVFYANPFPERIYLYRRPILHAASGGANLVDVIRDVVIHEVGHHFGFDDEQLDEMM